MIEGAPDDFESFPQGRLRLRWNRRQLLTTVTSELRVLCEAARWGAARGLADLGCLPDDELASLVPAIVPETELVEKAGVLWAHLRGSDSLVRLFSVGSPAGAVLGRFDGHTSLATCAERLSKERGMDPQRAFRYVRGLFLHLVSAGFCSPS